MRVGRVDVDAMLRGMTSTQFLEWIEYSGIEPFEFDVEVREDYRIASIVQAVVNMNRDTTRHPKPFELKEFVLHFDKVGKKEESRKPSQDWRQQKAIAQMMAEFYNAE